MINDNLNLALDNGHSSLKMVEAGQETVDLKCTDIKQQKRLTLHITSTKHPTA